MWTSSSDSWHQQGELLLTEYFLISDHSHGCTSTWITHSSSSASTIIFLYVEAWFELQWAVSTVATCLHTLTCCCFKTVYIFFVCCLMHIVPHVWFASVSAISFVSTNPSRFIFLSEHFFSSLCLHFYRTISNVSKASIIKRNILITKSSYCAESVWIPIHV